MQNKYLQKYLKYANRTNTLSGGSNKLQWVVDEQPLEMNPAETDARIALVTRLFEQILSQEKTPEEKEAIKSKLMRLAFRRDVACDPKLRGEPLFPQAEPLFLQAEAQPLFARAEPAKLTHEQIEQQSREARIAFLNKELEGPVSRETRLRYAQEIMRLQGNEERGLQNTRTAAQERRPNSTTVMTGYQTPSPPENVPVLANPDPARMNLRAALEALENSEN
jgi:hypothetical protein